MVVIDRILCPIDFSDISRHALLHAAAVARWYEAQLTALHVFTPPYIPSVMTSPELLRAVLPTDRGLQQLRDELNSWLGKLGEGLKTEAIVDQGPATWCILDRASSMPADLIVIGTHGHGGVDRLLLGSVTEKVMRRATCPVMTVPPAAEPPRALPFKRLLCAVDFSAPSLSALRYALSIAKEADARLVILHVVEWPAEDKLVEMDLELERYRALREARSQQELDALVSKEERTWCEPVTLLERGRSWQTILRVAEKEHTDLIVMGVHGRNVVDVAFFGSTTNQVVRRAPCPVLTLRQ
jgi:nucleotide-binding universal stress UspA family protein